MYSYSNIGDVDEALHLWLFQKFKLPNYFCVAYLYESYSVFVDPFEEPEYAILVHVVARMDRLTETMYDQWGSPLEM